MIKSKILSLILIVLAVIFALALVYARIRQKTLTGREQIPLSTKSGQPQGALQTGGSNQLPPGAPVPTVPETKLALTVTSPVNNSTVASPVMAVKGRTAPGADVAVNEVDTVADANGYFSVPLTLAEDENFIAVVASDASGNEVNQDLSVTYAPGQ